MQQNNSFFDPHKCNRSPTFLPCTIAKLGFLFAEFSPKMPVLAQILPPQICLITSMFGISFECFPPPLRGI